MSHQQGETWKMRSLSVISVTCNISQKIVLPVKCVTIVEKKDISQDCVVLKLRV